MHIRMRHRMPLAALLLAVVALAHAPRPAGAQSAQSAPPYYHARGMDCWDFWYVHDKGTYYAFYLECPIGDTLRFKHSVIGMATSPDLVHWSEYGKVITPGPPGAWDDQMTATGSTWRCQGQWMTLYSGYGVRGNRGTGLAVSDDLEHWTKVGNGPLPTLRSFRFRVPASPYWQGKGFVPDTMLDYSILGDPYVIPKPIDGWSYMVAKCIIDAAPLEERGCVGLFRTQDGVHWQSLGLIAAPKIYGELEVPQVWKHGDTWYMIFGGANINPPGRTNAIYASPTLEGPFEPTARPIVTLPDGTLWFYIAKIMTDPQGQDVLMANTSKSLMHPYPVVYEADGTVTLLRYSTAPIEWTPAGLTSFRGPVVSDGVGGVISNGTARLNANGHVVWGPSSGVAGSRWASDGMGGAVGAWLSSGRVYGSRIRASGSQPWGSGVVVCDAISGLFSPVVIGDGAGGAFYAWLDNRNGLGLDIYAQHVDSLGRRAWITNGIPVCAVAGNQLDQVLVPDASGGVIVAWTDGRPGAIGGSDIYAQRLDAVGLARWGPTGVVACAAPDTQRTPAIETDGQGGAFLAWWDARSGNRDVYMQRLNASGVQQWASLGVLVAGGPYDQLLPVLASDGALGTFVVWEDHRAGGLDGLDIYAQHVGWDGSLLWPAGGATVCTELSADTWPNVLTDGAGGIIVAWMDARNGPSSVPYTYETYVQRLGADGTQRWAPDGVRAEIGASMSPATRPSIAPDGAGGVYLDGPGGLQRILPEGRPGWVSNYAPVIRPITDVPGDEGGFVRISFDGAVAEGARLSPPVTAYQLWRRIPGPAPGVATSADGDWELVLTLPPTGQAVYTVLAPTRSDSSESGPNDDAFRVTTITSGPTLIVEGDPASGHSVDNLPPGPPLNVAGVARNDTTLRLTWSPRSEPDLWHYNVYRGDSKNFALTPASLLGVPIATSWDDPTYRAERAYWYKVTALDRHGNESSAATLAPPGGGGPGDVNYSTFLGRVFPNPVSGSATIEYGVARAGRFGIGIYDLAGRRVRTVQDRLSEPGVWHASWDARDDTGRALPSGVYWVRLRGDGTERSQRIVISE